MYGGKGEETVRTGVCMVVLWSVLLLGCAEEETPTLDNGTARRDEARVASQPELRTLAYDCDDSTYMVASLDRASDGLWLFLPGRTVLLPHVEAASGAKYSDGAITFWMKGREALLEVRDGRSVRCIENRRESWFEDAKLRGMDFRALGNEPGWTLELGPERSVLVTDYGQTRYEFATPEPEVEAEGPTAVYRARTGRTNIVIRTTWEPCMDSMDGTRYTHRVEIRIGDNRLLGCGRGLH